MKNTSVAIITCLAALLVLIWSPAAAIAAGPKFQSIGQFSVRHIEGGRYEICDGLGRILHLVPRDEEPPSGAQAHEVIRIPVKRVAITGDRDTSLLLALNAIDTVAAVTGEAKDWVIPRIRQGLEDGSIMSLGKSMTLDYEAMARLKPDVIFTWDESVIPKLSDLGVPVVINYGDEARTLKTQIQFVRFLAPFFGEFQAADEYVLRMEKALADIQQKAQRAKRRPKVIWGDVYEHRVMVEPGQSWAAQLIDSAKGEYLFKDVRGSSCLEVSLERFFSTGRQADIMFTYRTPTTGIGSKKALARTNPALAGIKPMSGGKIYFPLPIYNQSGHLMDQVITEIAAILQPELFPGHKLKFFLELPEE